VRLSISQGLLLASPFTLTSLPARTDTAVILANWIVPAGVHIVSDGPIPTKKSAKQTQQGTPGLLLSSAKTALFDENPAQTTISYTYDSLYRLTDAVYSPSTGSGGFEFHYTYDPVGNRLTQTTCAPNVPCATMHYEYDDADRLISVDGVAYTWDDNGNLLNDSASTYTYDSQNRLTTLTQDGHTYGFAYNGQGDRLTQSVDGVVTRYTLDLEAGLTQVLSDGSYAYLYGNERLAQINGSEADYFLGDALGSVRQLADASDEVRLAKNYEPYGTVMDDIGNTGSDYGFAGESQQNYWVYLRSRFYLTSIGRFASHDSWYGDYNRSQTLNGWAYAVDDPINRIDPSGLCDNISYAPGLYEVLGCRDSANGHYYLVTDIREQPWGKYASPSKFQPHLGAMQRKSTIKVPVWHRRNLWDEIAGTCTVNTLTDAVGYYLAHNFSTWEVNARNLMVEATPTIANVSNEWLLADIIGIAFSPYNRAAYNMEQHKVWLPYRSGLSGDARTNAWYSPLRILLNADAIRTDPNNPDSEIGYYGQFAVAHEDLYTADEVRKRGMDSALVGTPQIAPWKAAFSGNQHEGMEASYELALIIAYAVDRGLFMDPSYGATMYKARGESNPYDAGPSSPDSYTCRFPSPTFFYNQDIFTKYGEATALTTRELAERQGWPDDATMRTYVSQPRQAWQTGYPPCTPVSP
jgi:RHS repeat-associated protein